MPLDRGLGQSFPALVDRQPAGPDASVGRRCLDPAGAAVSGVRSNTAIEERLAPAATDRPVNCRANFLVTAHHSNQRLQAV
jgi:hypothetical protein